MIFMPMAVPRVNRPLLHRVGWNNVLLMSYTEQWRRHRRWMQSALLARDALTSYEPLQRQEIQKLLRDLIRDPGDALAHVKRSVAIFSHSPWRERRVTDVRTGVRY